MADWKIEGLVVTPTTSRVAISSARSPEVIACRERSSSQIDTPASDRARVRGFRCSFIWSSSGLSTSQALAAAMDSWAAFTTASGVTPYFSNSTL